MVSGFIFLMILSVSANLNCIGSPCTSCTSGYYLYNSKSCLFQCPSGYTPSGSTCLATANLNLFRLDFFTFTSYAASNIGEFTTPNNVPFSDPSFTTPIPIKSQGFYFSTLSQLSSTGTWVLGPDFTLKTMFTAFSDGNILQISDGSTVIFSLSLNNQNLVWAYCLKSVASDTCILSSSTTPWHYDYGWTTLRLSILQLDGAMQCNMQGQTTIQSGEDLCSGPLPSLIPLAVQEPPQVLPALST